jgi:hypothetical protein
MKKTIIIFLIGGILGSGAGFVLGIFFYPFIFLNDIVASDTIENRELKTIVADGTFIQANPNDPVHYGKGAVTIFKDVLHLGKAFEVGPGPKYKVLLVETASVKKSADVKKSNFVDLGLLRAFKGSQNYKIPANVDLKKYKSVVIWCETFSALISPATLDFRK